MNHPDTLSFWERESFFKGIDLAVIGSGIVGLNAALSFKEKNPKAKVVVIERGVLPEGASTRNAGFACFGSITELMDDLQNSSEEAVLALVEKRWRGLQRLRQKVGDKNMSYQPLGGFEIFRSTEGGILKACTEQLSYFNKKIGSITGIDNTYQLKPNIFNFKNIQPQLIHNTAEGQIDTGKMMLRLLQLAQNKGIRIFNGLTISALEDSSTEGAALMSTEGWSFKSTKVIVATNGFARRLMPALAVTPARNQVLVTHPIKSLAIKGCFHYDKGYYYFRNVGNRILLGGGRNLDFQTEMTDAFDTTQRIQNALIDLLKTVILPHTSFEIDTWWSGILGVGDIKKPIVQAISSNVVVAVRMGGMGVAIGSLVGEEAVEAII